VEVVVVVEGAQHHHRRAVVVAVLVHQAQVHKDLGVDKAILVQAGAGAVY
jgi:hypothetical protein